MLLNRRCSIWRRVLAVSGGYQETEVYKDIPCALTPISRFDQTQPYAHESTDLVWVPYWLILRKEDKIHTGIQSPDVENDPLQSYIYTINGIRRFDNGPTQRAYYARELD